jgi:hypothetical protein
MRYHRGLLFWGLALITGGAVALAVQQGYIDRSWLAGAWRLWPLILVAIGLSILLARTPAATIGTVVAALVVGTIAGSLIVVGGNFTCGGADPTSLTTRQGAFGNSATVQLEINCGTLKLGMDNAGLGSASWSVAFGHSGGSDPAISADSDRLEIRSPTDSWFDQGRQRWDVTLPLAPSYALDISPNASETTVNLAGGTFTSVSLQPNAGSVFLDLTDAKVGNVDLSLNAGSASIVIGGGADVRGSLSVNAGSIDLCTPGAFEINLTVKENITFSHNLAHSNLVRKGDTWSSISSHPFGGGSVVNLQITGNAGSFTLNPEGGCS